MITAHHEGPAVLAVGSLQSPKGVVAFFHGYGGSGESALPILEVLAPRHPSMLFLSVNGIQPHEGDGHRQWFSLQGFDPDDEAFFYKLQGRLDRAAQEVMRILRQYLEDRDAPLIVGGFSQGAALAIHLGLQGLPCAGVLAFSGFYQCKESITPQYHPPIFWSHGVEDHVIPVHMMRQSVGYLRHCGLSVETLEVPGVDHTISPQALSESSTWINRWIP